MTPVTPLTGYTITQNGAETVFRYVKSKYGIGAGCAFAFGGLFLGVALGLFVGLSIGGRTGEAIGFLTFLITPIFCGVAVPLLLNGLRRSGGEVAVTRDHIQVDGQSYDRKFISRIFVPDGPTMNVSQGSTTVMGFGLAGAVASAAHGASRVAEASGALISLAVESASAGIKFTYGEKDYWLVSQVPPKRAEALFFELEKTLGSR